MQESFDVFFSYNALDHAVVERVAHALRERGIRVFLDRWYLAAGQPWPQALERVLASCGAVAVFLGAEGLSPWQQRERDLALDRQGREPGFPVIPVLLPSADPPLGFLRLDTWVDLRSTIIDQSTLIVLEAAIRGQPPGPEIQQRIAQAIASVCPYRGLQPFREEDAAFFCGRQAFTEKLLDAIGRTSLVAVIGASGSGKSSVVRAGLIPRLRASRRSPVWDVVTLVPTDRPLHSLAAALVPMLEPDLSEVDRLAEVNKLASHLSDGAVSLRDVVARCLAKQPGTNRLLLFVDQWEELYTLCQNDTARQRFLNEILDASATGKSTVVLTIRGDFFGQALSNRAFADRLQDAQVNLGPMTRDELARSITEPAAAVNLTFEPGLDDRILGDVGNEPGNLPLLEFVLTELWEKRRGGRLHHDAYEQMGGIEGAIAARADEAFETLDAAQQDVARRFLIQMVRPGEGTADSRQRIALPEGDAAALTVIRHLADARLVVTGRDAATRSETVELTHEALIRNWTLLRSWVDADREFLRTKMRIEAAAELWKKENHDPSRLLAEGRPLAEGEEILAHRRQELNPYLINFIEASATRAQWGRQRKRLIVGGAMAILALLATVSTWFAYDATVQRNFAREQQAHAESQQLAAQAELLLKERSKLPQSTLLAVEGIKRFHIFAADQAVYHGLSLLGPKPAMEGAYPGLRDLVLSHHGKYLVQVPWDGPAHVQETVSGKEITTLANSLFDNIPALSISEVSFSDDDKYVVTVSSLGYSAFVWELPGGQEVFRTPPGRNAISAATLSSNASYLAIGDVHGMVYLWEVSSGNEILSFSSSDPPHTIKFSPNGRYLAVTSSLGIPGPLSASIVRLWDIEKKQEITQLQHQGAVTHFTFSPNGNYLATTSGSSVEIWETATGHKLTSVQHRYTVNSITFSPNSKYLLTGSSDDTARTWDVTNGQQQGRMDNGSTVNLAAFLITENLDCVVTVDQDGVIRIWDYYYDLRKENYIFQEVQQLQLEDNPNIVAFAHDSDGAYLLTVSHNLNQDVLISPEHYVKEVKVWKIEDIRKNFQLEHKDIVAGTQFSPDGKYLATFDVEFPKLDQSKLEYADMGSGSVSIWEVSTRRRLIDLKHDAAVSSIAYDPTGKYLATASLDGSVHIWEVASSKEVAHLKHNTWVNEVAFSSDGKYLATGTGKPKARGQRSGAARIWEWQTGHEVGHLQTNYEITRVAFSPDGKFLAAAGAGTLHILRAKDGQEVQQLQHEDSIRSVAFSPDGKIIGTVTVNEELQDKGETTLWNLSDDTKTVLRRQSAIAIAFSRNGEYLASANKDGNIWVWTTADGHELANVKQEESSLVGEITFSSDSKYLATAIGKAVRVWQVTTGQELARREHRDDLWSVTFSPDGKYVATASKDTTAGLWLWHPEDLIAEACARLTRNLTHAEWRQYLGEEVPYRTTCDNLPAGTQD